MYDTIKVWQLAIPDEAKRYFEEQCLSYVKGGIVDEDAVQASLDEDGDIPGKVTACLFCIRSASKGYRDIAGCIYEVLRYYTDEFLATLRSVGVESFVALAPEKGKEHSESLFFERLFDLQQNHGCRIGEAVRLYGTDAEERETRATYGIRVYLSEVR